MSEDDFRNRQTLGSQDVPRDSEPMPTVFPAWFFTVNVCMALSFVLLATPWLIVFLDSRFDLSEELGIVDLVRVFLLTSIIWFAPSLWLACRASNQAFKRKYWVRTSASVILVLTSFLSVALWCLATMFLGMLSAHPPV
jgi:hypothetical protein